MGLATIVGWVIILVVLAGIGSGGYYVLSRAGILDALSLPGLSRSDAGDQSAGDGEPVDLSVAFDGRVFGEYQDRLVQVDHQLYVRDPGSGVIDVRSGEIIEELNSPIDGLEFVEELPEAPDGPGRVVQMRITRTGDTIEVAKLPAPTEVPA